MPIYEFKCNGCGKVASLFFRSFSTPVHPVCPTCNSQDMSKLVSRAFFLKAQSQRLEEYNVERGMGRLNDPFNPTERIKWAREMGEELGDEYGAKLRDMAERAEGGEEVYDLYDPLYSYQAQVELKRQELMEQEGRGNVYQQISDEIVDSTPYAGAPPDSTAYDDVPR